MSIPDRDAVKAGLAKYVFLHGGKNSALRSSLVYQGLAESFGLTPEDRDKRRGSEPFWENEVRWARQALVDDGVFLPKEKSGHGLWQLTDLAIAKFKNSTDQTDSRLRLKFPHEHADLVAQNAFTPDSIEDARRLTLRAIVQRQGQHEFRVSLLKAYDFRCCVTGETIEQVLEAAHIFPYKGEATNHVQNGLLLRSDIHTLFDLKLIAIKSDYTLFTSPQLRNSLSYGLISGVKISLPKNEQQHPSIAALNLHFESCGFSSPR